MATTEKLTRNRNPAFPAVGLEAALDRVQVLLKHEGRKPMRPETAATHWGYSITSSAAQQALSALKQYGLLIDEKDGDARKLRLSPLALRIVLDKRTDSTERLKALREAALNPRVFAELWRKAGDDGSLPSNTELEHYLTLERKQPFYPDAVKNVIKIFESTITLAKLEKDDIIEGNGKGEDSEDDEGGQQTPMPRVQQPASHSNVIVRDLTFPLIGGEAAVLRVPLPLSEENFSLLTTLLQTMKAAIVKPPSSTTDTNNSPSE